MALRSNPSIVRVDYEGLTKRQARELKARCMTELGWSWGTFYNKMRGKQPIRPGEYATFLSIADDVTNSKRKAGSHVLASRA